MVEQRKTRGPGKRPAKVHMTLRVPQHIYDHFKGNRADMVAALEKVMMDELDNAPYRQHQTN